MPWKETTAMSLRFGFVQLASQEGANISALCREYGISRKTGYKWLNRYRESGGDPAILVDQPRRPHHSPLRTPDEMEDAVLAVREKHPAWGGRKIRVALEREGYTGIPSPSTITAILRRHNKIDPEEAKKHRPLQRFEKEYPNEMWQMDFKGYFACSEGINCHPLTILDDHSRFLLGLYACPNQRRDTVKACLTSVFRRYGLPERILADNGPPWGSDAATPYTKLGSWLIRLDIGISHGRPYHPQTQGKSERLHRTLNEELLSRRAFSNLEDCQLAFDSWRSMYNTERPHEAIDLGGPVGRYQPSPRPFPEQLPPVIYDSDAFVRKADMSGKISFRNQSFRIGKAFSYQLVAIRPTTTDGEYDVFYCKQPVAKISFRVDNT
jgi:transposase InsO family protein